MSAKGLQLRSVFLYWTIGQCVPHRLGGLRPRCDWLHLEVGQGPKANSAIMPSVVNRLSAVTEQFPFAFHLTLSFYEVLRKTRITVLQLLKKNTSKRNACAWVIVLFWSLSSSPEIHFPGQEDFNTFFLVDTLKIKTLVATISRRAGCSEATHMKRANPAARS